MVFSDTTNKNGIIQRIEDYTNLGDGVISGDTTLLKKATANVNETLHELEVELMLLKDDFYWDDPNKTDYPIATTPLVASQRDYNFDNLSFLKLQRVDVTYDGTNWYRATAFDSVGMSLPQGNDSKLDAQFSKTDPHYDAKAVGLWLYPMADATDVANGGTLRIEFARAFTEFSSTDTDTTPPIDRPFHELIAIGAAMKYALMKRDFQLASELEGQFVKGKRAMRDYYADRNEDSLLVPAPLEIISYK